MDGMEWLLNSFMRQPDCTGRSTIIRESERWSHGAVELAGIERCHAFFASKLACFSSALDKICEKEQPSNEQNMEQWLLDRGSPSDGHISMRMARCLLVIVVGNSLEGRIAVSKQERVLGS